MRALFVRFYESVGVGGLVQVLLGVTIILLGTTIAPLGIYLIRNPSFFLVHAVGWVIMVIITITMAILTVPKYRRSLRTISYDDILPTLAHSECAYCLVLRPFGRDGELIIPKEAKALNVTMEQVIGTAVRDILGLEAYGITDQKTLLMPPGVTFIRVSNDEWRMAARSLIRRAHSIFLILSPNQDIREGLAWEIEQIVSYGVQSRVIIILPPYDRYASWTHRRALRQACDILTQLDEPSRQAELERHELQLNKTALIVRREKNGATWWWGTIPEDTSRKTFLFTRRRQLIVTDKTYLSGLVEALKDTEQELSGLDSKPGIP